MAPAQHHAAPQHATPPSIHLPTSMTKPFRSESTVLSRNLALVAATTITLLALSACKPSTETSVRSGRAAAGAAIPVQVGKALRQTLPIPQTAIGYVQPLLTVAVRSQVDGIIQKLHFHEGDNVRVGDLLVEIDPRPYQVQLEQAQGQLARDQALLANAKLDLQRYQDAKEAVTQQQIDTASAAVAQYAGAVQIDQSAIDNAQLQLSYTKILAPISGRTGQFGLTEGNLVKANDAGSTLLTINQIAPISVVYSVSENILPKVQAVLAAQAASAGGIRVTAVPRGASGAPVEGRLSFIDNTVDPATGMIVLKAVFPNADLALWPGQFVDVSMELGHEDDDIVVPAAAVQQGQKTPQVFVVTPDKTVQVRAVKTGRNENGLTIILSGVNEGETVVTDGQLRLTNDAKITITSLEDFLKTSGTNASN